MSQKETDMEATMPLTEKVTLNGDNGLETSGVSGEPEATTDVLIEVSGVICSLEELHMQEEESDQKDVTDGGYDLPQAPDGGFGWVICCGCFLLFMIFGGFGRSEGLYFLQFKSRFQTSAQLATWPGSLLSTVNFLMGPLSAAVVNRYSVRTSMLIGGLLCVSGMILSGFAPNVYFLFFSHTILGGIGRGLLTGILLLNLYFDKHRSLATGIAMAGVGVGSLWVVPLTQYLFDTYGFTGAFLIFGGLASHTFITAMISRPLRLHLKFTKADAQRRMRLKDQAQTEEGLALMSSGNGCLHEASDQQVDKSDARHSTTSISDQQISNTDNVIEGTTDSIKRSNGLDEPSDQQRFNVNNSERHSVTSISDKYVLNADSVVEITTDSVKLKEKELGTSLTMVASEHPSDVDCYEIMHHKNTKDSLNIAGGDLQKKVSSIHLVTEKRKQDGCLKSSLKILFPVEYKRKKTGERKKMFEWTLIKNIPFMVFVLTNFLFVLAFRTSLTFLPAIALSKGLTDTEAALVLTISGALDTFGRIAIGFIMDLPPLRPYRPHIFNLLYFIIAGLCLLIPFLDNFTSFSFVCAVFGFTTGASVTQQLVVLVDIVGRDVMPSSLGIMRVFQGCGTLIGPPMAGALRDALGSFDSSFYLGGASMFGAALLLALSNFLLRLRKRASKEEVAHHENGDKA